MHIDIYPRDRHFVGALISGLVAAGSAIASGVSKRRQERRAQAYQRELLDYQNNLALENWNKENSYNTPLAQMDRYREAGLNPNLIYSQQNTSGSIGEYQPTSVSPILGPGEIVGNALNSSYQTFFDTYMKEQNIETNQLDIVGKGIANRTASYNADMAEQNYKISTATLSRVIDAKIAELDYLRLDYLNKGSYEKGKNDESIYIELSGASDSRKQYYDSSSEATLSASRSDAIDNLSSDGTDTTNSTLYTMYSDSFKKLAMDYALALKFGSQNAFNESRIKEASAIVSEIDSKWKENFDRLDFDKMSRGQMLKFILEFIAKLKTF